MKKDAIIIPRSIAESVISCKKRLSKLEAYVYLVLNQSDEKVSLGKLAEAWQWPNSNEVGRFLKQLKSDNLIGLEVGRTGTLITINATPNATPDATPKPPKTKGKRGINATPNATPDATPDATHKENIFEQPLFVDERKERLNKRFSIFGEFDYTFVEDHMEDVFYEWLKYKRERREKYKTKRTIEKCYNDIKKFSKNSPLIAKKMVEESMRNNWAGIFPLKDNNGGILYGKILKGNRTDIIGNSEGW